MEQWLSTVIPAAAYTTLPSVPLIDSCNGPFGVWHYLNCWDCKSPSGEYALFFPHLLRIINVEYRNIAEEQIDHFLSMLLILD